MIARDTARDRLAQICASLPEVTIGGDQHIRYAVRDRTFAWLLDDHHGDGQLAIALKVGPGENDAMALAEPDRFFIPAYVGPRGWLGTRLDAADVDWDEVGRLVTGSYRLVAPKRLAAAVAGG